MGGDVRLVIDLAKSIYHKALIVTSSCSCGFLVCIYRFVRSEQQIWNLFMIRLVSELSSVSSRNRFSQRFIRGLSSLVSEPFKIQNARKMRDNSDVFARPEIVSFDGFETLYYPRKPVAEQYSDIASSMGLKKSVEDIERDFGVIYLELQREHHNYGKRSGLKSTDEWWLELTVKLFGIPHYSKDDSSAKLCRKLLDHFTSDKAYALYDDVIPVLSVLRDHDISAVVATNSDPRVLKILQSLGVSNYINDSDVYISYEIDAAKPEKEFYDAIAKRYRSSHHSERRLSSQFLENCWHIGDDYDKDFLGAVRAGWNGVYLDRRRQSQFFSGKKIPVSQLDGCFTDQAQELDLSDGDFHIIANNRLVISNLTQLLRVFDLEGEGRGEGV